MKHTILVITAFITLISCKSKSSEDKIPDNQTTSIALDSIKKIDVHAHYRYPRDYHSNFFKTWNMQSVLVDVAKMDSSQISRSWKDYTANAKAQPDLFYLCSSLLGVGIDSPDFAENNIKRLQKEIDAGARMVKVWKNFGMVTKDNSGKFIQIDDPRLQEIWDFLAKKNIPVMAHIGEPVQAWRPLDDPKNPHYGYYSEHPEYHAYQHPEIPSYETIMDARDRWIARNPDLNILCAHLGSMSHNVDMVAERLDKFSNMSIELGARFGDLAGQDASKVRAFMTKYQDRILFGSDYGNYAEQNTLTETDLRTELANLEADYTRLWNYLSGTDSAEIRHQKSEGLALKKSILQKIYYENAAKLLKVKD